MQIQASIHCLPRITPKTWSSDTGGQLFRTSARTAKELLLQRGETLGVGRERADRRVLKAGTVLIALLVAIIVTAIFIMRIDNTR